MVKPHLSADPISRLWHWSQRRRAIRRYLTILPRRMTEDYGHRGPYTLRQVEACIARHKISPLRYVDFAVALFCDAAELKDFRPEDGRKPDYEAIRQELSGEYFGGDADFTSSDVARYSLNMESAATSLIMPATLAAIMAPMAAAIISRAAARGGGK